MWLSTQLGFYSIVRKNPDELHIRARCREDLDTLSKTIALPEPVESYPGSDYPWRILCDNADLTRLFALMAASITYDNFKSAIARHPTQHPKLSAHHDIHHRMFDWQMAKESRGLPTQYAIQELRHRQPKPSSSE